MDEGGTPLLTTREVSCPYCGEPVGTTLDSPRAGMRYTEDCPVCCQPIEFQVDMAADGDVRVAARREND